LVREGPKTCAETKGGGSEGRPRKKPEKKARRCGEGRSEVKKESLFALAACQMDW